MNKTLIIEEIKRLHEIMGINPKKILLESVGQPWFEALMKDIIEGAARNADGISDDILDEEAYNAIAPWIKKEFYLVNPSENDIKTYLKSINDDLTSGKSLVDIGQGINWYTLLDDVIKRNDGFYSKLVDDLINSGEFKEVSSLLSSTSAAKKIIDAGPEQNPKLYNQQIDNLISLRDAISKSSMDKELKDIITNKFNLTTLPKKSLQPDIDTAFSEIAKKIKGKNIQYDELVGLYDSAVANPKLWNPENITNQLNTIKNSVSESDPYFGAIPNVQAFVTKSANRFKLYQRLYKIYKGQPSKSVFVISSYAIFMIKMCLLAKVLKVLWDYGVKSGMDFEIYKTMYGDLSTQIKDLGGCVTIPYDGVVALLEGAQMVSVLTPGDKQVKAKLQEMLSNDQDNSDYKKFANELISQGATKEDFEKEGLPTEGLNFGNDNNNESSPKVYEQNLNSFKQYLIDNKLSDKDAKNDTDGDSGFWQANGKNYEFNDEKKTFDDKGDI